MVAEAGFEAASSTLLLFVVIHRSLMSFSSVLDRASSYPLETEDSLGFVKNCFTCDKAHIFYLLVEHPEEVDLARGHFPEERYGYFCVMRLPGPISRQNGQDNNL